MAPVSSTHPTMPMAILIVLAFFPSTSIAEDWPMVRGNPSLTGIAKGQLPSSLDLLWKFQTKGPVHSSAAIVGNRVYIGSNDKHLYCLDSASGSKVWEMTTEAQVESSPLVLDGKVYFGSSDSFLYCLDQHSGGLEWKYETGDKITGGPNWIAGPDARSKRVIVGSYDGSLHCVDAMSGQAVWTYQTDNYVNGSPAVSGGKVVVGGCDARIHIISALDGKKISEVDAEAYIAASVALDHDMAYTGHYGNKFLCVDIQAAKVVWTYQDRAFPFFSSAAVSGDRVVVGCRDKRLHCISKEKGEPLWTLRTRGQVDSSPVICGDKVIVGSEDGRLYLVSLVDGKEIWSYEIGEGIISSPAVSEGRVVIGSEDGYVYAFGSKGIPLIDQEVR